MDRFDDPAARHLWQKAFEAAAEAARAKRIATQAGEAWRRGGVYGTDPWADSLRATQAWRKAQAETHAANHALLEALGLDWRNHL